MMTKFPRFGRFLRWTAAFLAGGSAFALSGCDPAVRDTILSGLESATTGLATTFIQAFFLKLQETDTSTTAMLQVVDDLVRMLA
jgi:hypothetical protein